MDKLDGLKNSSSCSKTKYQSHRTVVPEYVSVLSAACVDVSIEHLLQRVGREGPVLALLGVFGVVEVAVVDLNRVIVVVVVVVVILTVDEQRVAEQEEGEMVALHDWFTRDILLHGTMYGWI